METNLLVPHGTHEPEAPIEYTDALYAVFVRIATGNTIQGAIESVGAFGRTTFYKWRKSYPDWVEWVEQRARAVVTEKRREKEHALVALSLDAEIQARRQMLVEAQNVIDRLIAIATDPESAPKDAIAAARALRTFTVEGLTYARKGDPPREPEPPRELLFDPHSESLGDAVIEIPPGSRVNIETPDTIEMMPGD
jgi:hypothetical protein